MADKKYYWLSPHRIKIGGIWRNTGDDFPADKVTDEKLVQWLKDGDAGELPFKAKAGRSSNDMKLLQDKLKDLSEKFTIIEGENKTLVKSNGELQKTVDDSDSDADKITELEDAAKLDATKITELETKVKEDADTIADFETDAKTAGEKITELEKQVKKLTEAAKK